MPKKIENYAVLRMEGIELFILVGALRSIIRTNYRRRWTRSMYVVIIIYFWIFWACQQMG